MEIALNAIRIDGGTQPRAAINEDVVAEYALKMEEGAEFPPIVVFFDGVDTWLADGFHRLHAATKAHRTHIEAMTKRGTKRDAVLYSVGANSTHGLPRTNADKSRAIEIMLADPEWAGWVNTEIARHCGVDESSVRRHREKHTSALPKNETPTSKLFNHPKTGKPTMMRTENIGKRPTGVRRDYEPKEVRAQQIAELSKEGYRAEQIAAKLKISEQQVKSIARTSSIQLVDAALGRPHRIDNRKIIESAVMELDSAAASLRVLPISLEGIEPAEASTWAESIAESIREFRAFERKLRSHHD